MRVYLNGRYQERDQAGLDVDDRSFLFGDGVYEVIRLYDGRPFELDRHLDRLEQSERGVWMEPVDRGTLAEVVAEFAAHEGRTWPDAIVYIQVSRGAAPRSHSFPDPPVPPTVLVWARPVKPVAPEQARAGIAAVTVADDRWARCWIKTVNLLPNVLAKEAARRRGADDAVFVRDGMAIEATSANLFVVRGGRLYTAPVTNYILPGVTRAVVLELADELGLEVRLEPTPVEALEAAEEVFLTGTTTEVMPVTRLDGRTVGTGRMGPVTEALWRAFRRRVGRPGDA
ncbi:MAG: aminotransferase class IV [Actinomycetia bacterium]|nr:aminotransferase class IV [Actinomycetes bacterium]